MPDSPTPENPVVIDPSAIRSQIATAARDLGVIVTFSTALFGMIGRRDISGIVTFLQSDAAGPAITVLATAAGAAIVTYRQWRARHDRKVLVAAATNRPNTAVIVKDSPNG